MFFFVIMLMLIPTLSLCRSVHRPANPHLPEATIWYADQPDVRYTKKDSHLEAYPLFHFSLDDITPYLIPEGGISYRYDDEAIVSNQEINTAIETLLAELRTTRKNKFTHFTLLQNKNFNRRAMSGLIVLKFKQHPFVLKLLVETPRTFFNPFGKGLEPIPMFYMGRGGNRHIYGLTRLKNRTRVINAIAQMPDWKERVAIPRKWAWLPKHNRTLHIHGKNIGFGSELHTIMPSTYAIIADAMPTTERTTLTHRERGRQAMQLCNDLHNALDAHRDNFIFRYDPEKEMDIITLLDTEHFPTMLGYKKPKRFRNHNAWYQELTCKAIKDMLFRNKKERQQAQIETHHLMLQ